MTSGAKPPRHGFTIIELFIVIGALLFLLAFLLPAIQKVREAAGRSPLVAPKIINLSAKGVCIVSEAQLHPGEPLEVELTVP